jgi:hypothetical protein
MHLIQENAVYVSLFEFVITNIDSNPELNALLSKCQIKPNITRDHSIVLTQFDILIILGYLINRMPNTDFVNGINEASRTSDTIQPEIAMRNVLLYMLNTSIDIMQNITIAKKRKRGEGKVIRKYRNKDYLTRRKLKKNENKERLDKKVTRKNEKLSRNKHRNLPIMRYT